ncbi:MAG: hypothetical protein HY275_05490 [Gemmatimonadetes bacterium]|nr:hypothetical protein [Gemmatimonadota bacterium]
MIPRIARLLVPLAALLFGAASLEAQRPRPTQEQVDRMSGPMFGLRGAYDFDSQSGGYGAQVRIPLDWNLQFAPSVEAYSSAGGTTTQGNVDLIATGRRGWFYLGGGLAIIKPPVGDTKYGANLYPGLDLPELLDLPVRPFVEARWTFSDGKNPFRLVVGVNFLFGQR